MTTTVQIDSAELATLREKARLYDEAARQEPTGYIDTILDSYYTLDEWPVYVPEEDNLNGVYPVYINPVPQAMAAPDGWQLVPRVPTDEMCVAGLFAETLAEDEHERHYLAYIGSDAARQAYVLMLKAAPEYKL